jgi:hypothetical protein
MLYDIIQVFGGCCATVYTLEALVNQAPNSTLLITACQFLFISLLSLPGQLTPDFRLKPRSIPLACLFIIN